MARTAHDRIAPRLAAKLAAAFALGCAVALILTAGGGSRAGAASAIPSAHATGATVAAPPTLAPSRPDTTATQHFPRTPAGAAAAATAWCQTTTEAFIDGGWDRAVKALATGAFRALALRYERAAALVHRRLATAGTPYALRLWPLGFAVQQYSPTAARVRVWQLYVLAISAPEADTVFTTTTVALRWSRGGWTVTAAPPGADLAPPAAGASPTQIAAWVRAANRLEPYAYAP